MHSCQVSHSCSSDSLSMVPATHHGSDRLDCTACGWPGTGGLPHSPILPSRMAHTAFSSFSISAGGFVKFTEGFFKLWVLSGFLRFGGGQERAVHKAQGLRTVE